MWDDPEFLAFVAAAAGRPGEDLPRLALADWLEDRGEREWGEFVRAHTRCRGEPQKTEMPAREWKALVAQCDDALARHGARWYPAETFGRPITFGVEWTSRVWKAYTHLAAGLPHTLTVLPSAYTPDRATRAARIPGLVVRLIGCLPASGWEVYGDTAGSVADGLWHRAALPPPDGEAGRPAAEDGDLPPFVWDALTGDWVSDVNWKRYRSVRQATAAARVAVDRVQAGLRDGSLRIGPAGGLMWT